MLFALILLTVKSPAASRLLSYSGNNLCLMGFKCIHVTSRVSELWPVLNEPAKQKEKK